MLAVTKLDRLGRHALDVCAAIDTLSELDVRGHSLAFGGADRASTAGKISMQIVNAVAEFGRDLTGRAGQWGHPTGSLGAAAVRQAVVVDQRATDGDYAAAGAE